MPNGLTISAEDPFGEHEFHFPEDSSDMSWVYVGYKFKQRASRDDPGAKCWWVVTKILGRNAFKARPLVN